VPHRFDVSLPCVFFAASFVYRTRMGTAICWFVNSVASPMEQEGQAIARGLRQRDPDLLDHLIEQYQYRLLRYLLFLTGNKETAEDLFQETWLRVLERGRQYDGKWEFGAWLFAIARHLVIDLRKRKHPQSPDPLTAPGEDTKPLEVESTGDTSAFELLARREESEQLAGALGRLPAVYREALVLRFQEDLALEEIAEVVGAPLSTVKSRLYRGLEALRELLEGARI
jgi:RNA polymerase sigma-70 factor (ECF subfamily)